MIAVIFEVWPAEGRTKEYLDLAAVLRDDLATVDGFLAVERFQSSRRAWEAAVAVILAGRDGGLGMARAPEPQGNASAGRAGIFRNCRLRIATVTRDYGLNDRNLAPMDSQAAHPA